MHILCIGAGPIGLIAANALMRLGHTVRCFDPSTDKPKMSLALAQSTLNFLDSLSISLDAGELLTEIHVSETGVPGSVLLSSKELGLPQFGRVVCSHALKYILEDATDLVIEKSKVTAITARSISSDPSITLNGGEILPADLIILADGGRSGLTKGLGFQPQMRPFGRTALIGRLQVGTPMAGRAFERFVGTGPLAVLPVDGVEYGFIWSLSPTMARRYAERPNELTGALTGSFGNMLGDLMLSNTPVQVPLVERWIDQPFRPGVVLLGNGAQTIHPVAGQGLNLALRGLEILVSYLRTGPVDDALSRAHKAWSPSRNRTRAASSALETIFDRNDAGRKFLTGTTLAFIDQNIWLKRLIVDAGMGIRP